MTNVTVQPLVSDRIATVSTMEQVRLDLGTLEDGGSPRVGELEQSHVELLAGLEASSLPPVVVCRRSMRVIDGHHRVAAALRRGDEEIDAHLFDGSPEEAFVHAVRANVRHGLPLSKEERELAVARILDSHPHLSDRAIADVVGVSAKAVASSRERLPERAATRLGRDGRSRPVSGAAGRLRAAEIISAAPYLPLREVAAKAGISVATAHDVRRRLREGVDPVPDGARAVGRVRGRRSFLRRVDEPGRERTKVDRRAAMGVLRNDPSLRLTEIGRGLLRWLEVQAVVPSRSEVMAEAVPSHCVDIVVGLVRDQAQVLSRFADDLQRRRALAADEN